jgi:tetratricopeptide (TPR) repeat protein
MGFGKKLNMWLHSICKSPQEQGDATISHVDKNLFFHYLINEITSQEDTAKQLISVNSVLVGIYIALILNSQSIEAIRKIFTIKYLIGGYNASWIHSSVLFFIIITPILCWFYSLINCYRVIDPKIPVSDLLSYSNDSTNYLNSVINFKRGLLKWSYWYMFIGLFVIFCITGVALLYQTVGITADWNNKGFELINQGNYSEAIIALDKSIELNPNSAIPWINKGAALSGLGKYDEALKAFNKATGLDPNNAVIWNDMGNTLDNMKLYDEALQAFNKSINLDSQNGYIWNNKGMTLYDLGKYDEALKALDIALKLDPNYAIGWNNRGLVLSNLGKYDEALQAYNKSIELSPYETETWINRGITFGYMDKNDEAQLDYVKALKLDPKNARAMEGEGLALSALGRTTEASAAFAKAKELGYNG